MKKMSVNKNLHNMIPILIPCLMEVAVHNIIKLFPTSDLEPGYTIICPTSETAIRMRCLMIFVRQEGLFTDPGHDRWLLPSLVGTCKNTSPHGFQHSYPSSLEQSVCSHVERCLYYPSLANSSLLCLSHYTSETPIKSQ